MGETQDIRYQKRITLVVFVKPQNLICHKNTKTLKDTKKNISTQIYTD